MSNELNRKQFMIAGAAAGVAIAGFNRMGHAQDAAGSITQLAILGLNEEKADEAIALLKELVKAVEDNEPGVLAYICHRSEKEPGKIVFFEVYKDAATLQAHGATPHLAKMREAFTAGILKPPVDIQKLNHIAGFSR